MSWLDRIAEVAGQEWKPVSTPAIAGATAVAALLCWFASTGQQWVPVLDSANLAFHEAGHPLFGLLFGENFAVYGGTLGQLVFPAVVTGSFWWRRETVPFALAAAWLCENFWNIARYMADARAHELPLVGGGEHDWTEIFLRWGLLGSDTGIASFVRWMAWLALLAIWGWLAWRWRQDREFA